MCIQAVFTAEGGMDTEIEEAKKVLELGKSYEVVNANVENWHTWLKLKDHPTKLFNVSLFDVDFNKIMNKFYKQ